MLVLALEPALELVLLKNEKVRKHAKQLNYPSARPQTGYFIRLTAYEMVYIIEGTNMRAGDGACRGYWGTKLERHLERAKTIEFPCALETLSPEMVPILVKLGRLSPEIVTILVQKRQPRAYITCG